MLKSDGQDLGYELNAKNLRNAANKELKQRNAQTYKALDNMPDSQKPIYFENPETGQMERKPTKPKSDLTLGVTDSDVAHKLIQKKQDEQRILDRKPFRTGSTFTPRQGSMEMAKAVPEEKVQDLQQALHRRHTARQDSINPSNMKNGSARNVVVDDVKESEKRLMHKQGTFETVDEDGDIDVSVKGKMNVKRGSSGGMAKKDSGFAEGNKSGFAQPKEVHVKKMKGEDIEWDDDAQG